MALFSDRINYNLLKTIVKTFPESKFFLFGKVDITEKAGKQLFEEIINSDNVCYKGPRKYSYIEPFLYASKLAIALYKQDTIHNQLNSLKIIQYLSYGVSIVSTPFNDYQEAMDKKLLYMTKSEDDFVIQCRKVLNAMPDQNEIDRRVKYAKHFLYSNLIERIESFLLLQ